MGLFSPLKPKKKGIINKAVDQRNSMLNDISNWQNGQNPNTTAKDQFPNLNPKKKEKKRGLFG